MRASSVERLNRRTIVRSFGSRGRHLFSTWVHVFRVLYSFEARKSVPILTRNKLYNYYRECAILPKFKNKRRPQHQSVIKT